MVEETQSITARLVRKTVAPESAAHSGVQRLRIKNADRAVVLALVAYSLIIVGVLLKSGVNVTLEDGYYYFKIAQNLAHGAGSTFDGLHPTNGYHPLWLFCLVPIFRLGVTPQVALSLGILLQGAMMAVGAVLLYGMMRLTLGRPAASLTTLLWLHFTYPLALSGLEFSLHAMGILTIAFLYLRWFSREIPRRPGLWLALGVALSLTFLARLDTLLLATILSLSLVIREFKRYWRGTGSSFGAFLRLTALTLPVVAVCLLYIGANIRLFGHPLPVSGVIKRDWSAYLLAQDPVYRTHGWAAAKLHNLLWPLGNLRANYPLVIGAFCVPGLSLLVSAGPGGSRRWDRVRQTLQPYGPFIWYSAIQYLTTSLLYHGEMSTISWYYVVQPWIAAVSMGILFQELTSVLNGGLLRTRPTIGARSALCAALLAGWCLVPLRTLLSVWKWQDQTRRGLIPTPFQDAALWVRTHLPPDAVIGSWNAGTISYLSGRRVVNLDGLVNSWDYYQSDHNDLCRYWRTTGIFYLVDGFDGLNALALVPTYSGYAACSNRMERVWQDHYLWQDKVYVWSKDHRPATWRMTAYRMHRNQIHRNQQINKSFSKEFH